MGKDGAACVRPPSRASPIAGRAEPLDSLEQGERKVKRTVTIVAGIAALALVAYFGSRLWAQAPGAAAAAPAQTRVAVINLLQVIKNYNKAKFYETELEETLKPFRNKAEKLKSDM